MCVCSVGEGGRERGREGVCVDEGVCVFVCICMCVFMYVCVCVFIYVLSYHVLVHSVTLIISIYSTNYLILKSNHSKFCLRYSSLFEFLFLS